MVGFVGYTLGSLAVALRGIPRTAPILVRMPDGTFARVRYVRPVRITEGGRELEPGVGEEQDVYSIALELE